MELSEITVHRMNPQIDPGLHVWGWEIPVYLFLGGLVAGMMILGGHLLVRGHGRRPQSVCHRLPALAIALLSLGMLALFLDLEHKRFVWRLYTTFEITSPMSWGAWILLLVYPALVAAFLVARGTLRPDLARRIGQLNMALGALLGIYTGILLSALGARPLWNSALLGPLFLLSGLSSAAALVHLLARDREEQTLFMKADNAFLATELVLLVLFFLGLVSSTRVHLEAARLFFGGPLTALFWVFVVGLGLVVPLVIQPLAVRHRVAHTAVAPLLVIAGGLALRFVIVYAGQMSHWR
ncbi:MAG TPA: polysulfide reductase [Acidobacteria bacterium]|nr:polysulfide reductase [Acidobacteriota bacterium]